MESAWIEGRPATAQEAVAAAADLVRASRLPVVTGELGDADGVRAAIALAQAAGGALDHAESRDIFPAISALRDNGMILGAPAEMRRRADRFLVIGAEAFAGSADLAQFLFSGTRDLGAPGNGEPRKIVWLGASEALPPLSNDVTIERVDCPAESLGDAVAALRAAVNGRPFGKAPLAADKVRDLAGWLAAAQFGCAVFAPRAMDAVDIEMLAGLVSDLNAATRFAVLPAYRRGDAFGAALVSTWATGFPLRLGFGRGYPDHDAHLFDAARLIASGEADLVVHVAARENAAEPDWSGCVPVIALTAGGEAWVHPPKVAVEIGVAGRDHAGAVLDGRFGSFVPVAASAASDRPRASHILGAMAALLGRALQNEKAA